MFKTLVLACAVASPTDCWEYTDTRGPYRSYELCQQRAYEMGNAIVEINKGNLMPQSFRCVELKGTQL